MAHNYSALSSISSEMFARSISSFDEARFTKSDAVDLRRVELLLDVREGALGTLELYLEKYDCAKCAKPLRFSDFVYTAIKDASHPTSFILHTLLGSKYLRNEHRPVRCYNCDTVSTKPLNYMGSNYTCCNHGNI